MTSAVANPVLQKLPVRVLGLGRDLIIGTILSLSPLTAVIVLGWLTRRMRATVRRRWYGEATTRSGWLLGPQDSGWVAWLIGGLAGNIRGGIMAATGLFCLTMPFTLAWLGAWWAGWENSFNKGYEQAAVGPIVWIAAALISLPVLAHLPLGLAHAAAEDRFSAFFEWRKIRSIAASAGWRLAWLAILSAVISVPFVGLRALPVFIEGIVPGFADMSFEGQTRVAQSFDLLAAALAFAFAVFLRHRAAVIYSIATPRAAAGRFAGLWTDHPVRSASPKGRTPGKIAAAVWLIVACLIWTAVPLLIVAGQFMSYDPVLWLTHPVFLLPWSG